MLSIVYATDQGRIYQVGERKDYQVEFGNMMLFIHYSNLLRLESFLRRMDISCLEHLKVQPFNKIIIHPLNSTGYYAFMEEEFLDLREFIMDSVSIIKVGCEIEEILN